MSNAVKEVRRSLEEKTKALEEKARLEKLIIDRNLAVKILEEENRTHNETIKELENRHNDAVKELEDKIANLEQQMKLLLPEASSSQTISEPPQYVSENVDESVSVGALQESGQKEVEVPKEGSKKKRRSFL